LQILLATSGIDLVVQFSKIGSKVCLVILMGVFFGTMYTQTNHNLTIFITIYFLSKEFGENFVIIKGG
jgi:hypothetical protein